MSQKKTDYQPFSTVTALIFSTALYCYSSAVLSEQGQMDIYCSGLASSFLVRSDQNTVLLKFKSDVQPAYSCKKSSFNGISIPIPGSGGASAPVAGTVTRQELHECTMTPLQNTCSGDFYTFSSSEIALDAPGKITQFRASEPDYSQGKYVHNIYVTSSPLLTNLLEEFTTNKNRNKKYKLTVIKETNMQYKVINMTAAPMTLTRCAVTDHRSGTPVTTYKSGSECTTNVAPPPLGNTNSGAASGPGDKTFQPGNTTHTK